MIKYSALIILFTLEIDKYLISEIIDKKRLINQIYKCQQDASNRAIAASGVSDHEVLFLLFQAAPSTGAPLPDPNVQDAWPPVE